MSKRKKCPNTFHHYVPQCYLRQFGFPKNCHNKKDYFVYAFDKQTGKIYPKSVDDVCGKDFFYKLSFNTSQHANVDELYLETYYFAKRIETELSRLLVFMEKHLTATIADNCNGLCLPKIGKQYLAKQLVIQFLRHPNIREYDFKLIDDIDSQVRGFITRNNLQDTPGSKELLNGSDKFYEDATFTHAMLSFMNEDLISLMMNALADNIWIYHYSPNGDFFASDNPVHVTPHYKGEVRHTLMGLNQYGAEVSWTLNPYFTLSIYDKEYFANMAKYNDAIIPCTEDELRHYNIIRYGCAKKYVFSKSQNFEHANVCFQINQLLHIQ